MYLFGMAAIPSVYGSVTLCMAVVLANIEMNQKIKQYLKNISQ